MIFLLLKVRRGEGSFSKGDRFLFLKNTRSEVGLNTVMYIYFLLRLWIFLKILNFHAAASLKSNDFSLSLAHYSRG